jgi:hypothetical protein
MKMSYKILLSLFAVGIILAGYWFLNQPGGAKEDGSITFILIDQNGKEVIHDELSFVSNKEDGTPTTLYDIINDHYNVVCADQNRQPDPNCGPNSLLSEGRVILEIENIKTDWFNHYFALYQNGQYTTKGVVQLVFKDGDVIEMRYTKL